ncbi:MAG: CehA/McbA family metallohydrolase, partial [Verrucomicrobiales bacterium]|nr:CehA/McbA family metallohydrolase [Verrucomicrobiales bacterium]
MKYFLVFWAMMAVGVSGEVIEVTKANVGELPKGKEADGIIGDFVLRSDAVEAVVSGNLPMRKANMGTFWGTGATGMTPGCLYDLTPKGEGNDQLTIFSPLNQQGRVSWVKPVEEGLAEGESAVETVITAAIGDGIYRKHVYVVKDGVRGVFIETTLRNQRGSGWTVKMNDKWTGLARSDYSQGVVFGDAVDPDDRAGYAFGFVEARGAKIPKGEVTLAPGAEVKVVRFLAVAGSPAEAFGIVAGMRGETGTLKVEIGKEGEGGLDRSAVVVLLESEKKLVGYAGGDGVGEFGLRPGEYTVRVEEVGRGMHRERVVVKAGETTVLAAKLGARSSVSFAVKGEDGKGMPCKVQFIGIDGTAAPDLGPNNRAHGCVDQWHSGEGEFEVALAPGKYRVVVTRGVEYSHLSEEIELGAGQSVAVGGVLKRMIDTSGWVSTDYHNHSTPSGDNTCGTNDRIINLVAEHIEFAPTTEHNRLYDWAPHIEALGLGGLIATVPGMELTGSKQHQNMFPLKPERWRQDGGAPVWEPDPRVNALQLREFQGGDPDRWVHLNHPSMERDFFDRDGDGKVDGGYALFPAMIDGLETENYVTKFNKGEGILSGAPYRVLDPLEKGSRVRMIREFIWLQLLNQGVRVWAIAVADAHTVYGNGVGGWRTYVPSSTDAPAEIDWRELSQNSKKGQMVLTTGPFMEVEAGNGVLPGGEMVVEEKKVELNVRVQCTDWVDIDRVQVLVNGRQREDLNFTRETHPDWFADGVVKFDRRIPVRLEGDSHLIVVALGEGHDLKTGYGTSPQAEMWPCAYHNPIFVDVGGDGFEANGDTLGFP